MTRAEVRASPRVLERLRLAVPWDAAVAILGPEGEHVGRRKVVPLPADGPAPHDLSPQAAIDRLEALRAEGFEYLLVGESAYAWLDSSGPFLAHLESRYRLIERDPHSCAVYALHGAPDETGADGLPLPPVDLIRLTSGLYRRAHDPQAIRRRFESTAAQGAEWIRETLADNGAPIEAAGALLDFGSGCGRVMRNWKDLPGTLHGCDYNPHLVAWCAANLPFARFEENGLEPPLPYPDESFDLVYSISIFTHLDAPLQVPWIRELARVVRPGGLLLITVSGEERLRPLPIWDRVHEPFEAGELVVDKPDRAGTNACAVYHPWAYVRDTLARDLEIVDYRSGGAVDVRQDALLMRRPG